MCFDVVKNISILTGKVWLFCIKFVYLSKMCNLLKKIGCGLVASDLLGRWVCNESCAGNVFGC